MNLQGKALYNLLRISAAQSHPWQVENYRLWPAEKIFNELRALEIPLTQKSFFEFAADCDTPEELIDCLWVREEAEEGSERAYLLIFELWRRLLPEKHALSIFCDELDHCIEQYDRDELKDETKLQNGLGSLEDILDDSDLEEKEVFLALSTYCAHDLAGFLYDYIADKIDDGDETYASELLDGFYPYIPDRKWFDFLRARLYIMTDEEEGTKMVQRILDQLEEEPNLNLLIEIFSSSHDQEIFKQALDQAALLIKTQEQLQEVLSLLKDNPDEQRRMRQLQNSIARKNR